MLGDLRSLAKRFASQAWPQTPCPNCLAGQLSPEQIDLQQSHVSEQNRSHEDWEPEWIEGFFRAVLRCGNPQCKEVAVAVGEYRVGLVADQRRDYDYDEFLLLRFVIPALPLMTFPAKCPEIVRKRVTEASQVLWTDPSAAANRLRLAIEDLLTAEKIPKTTLKNGKRTPLKTHDRIVKLKQTHQEAGDTLEALKWIGNQGSHEDSLSTTDVLDGAELLEHAIKLLYDTSAGEIARRVQQINKRKGLARKRSNSAPRSR